MKHGLQIWTYLVNSASLSGRVVIEPFRCESWKNLWGGERVFTLNRHPWPQITAGSSPTETHAQVVHNAAFCIISLKTCNFLNAPAELYCRAAYRCWSYVCGISSALLSCDNPFQRFMTDSSRQWCVVQCWYALERCLPERPWWISWPWMLYRPIDADDAFAEFPSALLHCDNHFKRFLTDSARQYFLVRCW